MIQIIVQSKNSFNRKGFNVKEVTVSTFDNPNALDNYEINIIDLRDDEIWKNEDDNYKSLNCMKDITRLSELIERTKDLTNIVIILPQNIHLNYRMGRTGDYFDSIALRDMARTLSKDILSQLYQLSIYVKLLFSNTITTINGRDVNAASYFDSVEYKHKTLTKSKTSDHATTILLEEVLVTTLDLDYKYLNDFLIGIDLIKKEEEIPKWMEEVKMFDDLDNISVIEVNKARIKEAQDEISKAQENLNINNHYKSILCTSGNVLEDTIREVFCKMLDVDLSDYEDKLKQDFTIKTEGFTFIGEIKGVNDNVRSPFISQLDVHYQSYLEDNPDDSQEKIKALLVINHQKNKPITDREPVHKTQIDLAVRNGSLIIETITLLRIFEKFKNGEFNKAKVIELFTRNTGLLTEDQIK